MNEAQKNELLKTAKASVQSAIAGDNAPKPTSDDPALNEHCGCFVTLHKGDQLRGCIGNFTSDKPLIELIAEMAVASATQDPRFLATPIKSDELNEMHLEISVLSPLKKTDDPLSLRLGEDGIYIRNGYASGCFLPQVATETGWSKEEFLCYCCSHKAGLDPYAWKDADTEVYLFTARVFGADFSDIE